MTEEWNAYHEYYKLILRDAIKRINEYGYYDYLPWLINLLIAKKIMNQGNLDRWYNKCSMDVSISLQSGIGVKP